VIVFTPVYVRERERGYVCLYAGIFVFVCERGRGGEEEGGVCVGGRASMLLSVYVCVCTCVHARVHVCIT